MGVTAAVAAAPVVVLAAAGFAGARAYQRRVLTRAQLALDQLLDRLERGELTKRPRESLLGAIVAAATSIHLGDSETRCSGLGIWYSWSVLENLTARGEARAFPFSSPDHQYPTPNTEHRVKQLSARTSTV